MASFKTAFGIISAVALAAVCGLPATTPAAAQGPRPEAAVLGNCGAMKLRFAASAVASIAATPEFKNIPETRMAFTTTAPGCVVVQYNAAATAQADTSLVVQALVDGQSGGAPINPIFVTDGEVQTKTVTFAFKNVPADQHVVLVQHRKEGTGNAFMHDHTTLVFHR